MHIVVWVKKLLKEKTNTFISDNKTLSCGRFTYVIYISLTTLIYLWIWLSNAPASLQLSLMHVGVSVDCNAGLHYRILTQVTISLFTEKS